MEKSVMSKKPVITPAAVAPIADNQSSPTAALRSQLLMRDYRLFEKKTFISGAFALLVLAHPAYGWAQRAASTDQAEQSHKETAEASFMAENQAAMSKMMTDMAVKPSGNVDADFTAMMIPHHQGAIDMAAAELHYGHNPKLRQIARNIIAGQRQQIGAMKAALDQPLSEATPSSTQSGHVSQDGARSEPNASR
jgi:DUF305 family protein family protein